MYVPVPLKGNAMRDPNLKALTVYVDKAIYEAARRAAAADGRSVTNFVARIISASPFLQVPIRDLERMTGKGAARQVHLEDAIAAAVKRGPVKPSKHK